MGLTLIETLVATGILAVLVGVSLPVVGSFIKKGELSAEVAAAKNAITAFSTHTAENAGEFLPGYGRFEAQDHKGNALHFPASGRYPWRLAPYLDYDFRALYVNKGRQRLEKIGMDDPYGLSVSPTLGMNTYFVGGNFEHFHPGGLGAYFGKFCVRRIGDVHSPSKLIVFASARSNHGGEDIEGYFEIRPPNLTRRIWASQYDEAAHPSATGAVHFRYDERAVTAMLDGHVEILDFSQLEDMRRWADPAARADDPNWMLKPLANN